MISNDLFPDALASLPPSGVRPVTTGPLIFPVEVAQLREMAGDATRTVAKKIDDQRHVINTYEAAITELQERLRLSVGIVWVLAGLNVVLVILCVWRIWQ